MEVVGSEIGQKMRKEVNLQSSTQTFLFQSAIKAKLTELGCYVDDELPDYVMVMVANKRTRAQMEDDLQLFLGDNTELFVNWLHQVLKKLQEVTVTTPSATKTPEPEKKKERSASKDRKTKEKKLKKKSDLKKAKKKDKDKIKSQKKKEEKKSHKKKKSKHHEMIRPNIPPLLMNMEKDSEPSITDVFAGQILKNHGVLLETHVEESKETKPVVEVKRPIIPIIDPATILSEPTEPEAEKTDKITPSTGEPAPKEDQINEINEIEAKIQGLKQKLVEQLDSMSDDEDFLNIRTEAEELMNDFAEDVFQEISQQTTTSVATPPIPPPKPKSPLLLPETLESPPPQPKSPPESSKNDPKETPTVETLPQIELNLPKRPVRERLGALETKKTPIVEKETVKPHASPERYTPEREPEIKPAKTAKSRLGEVVEPQRKHSTDGGDKSDSKRMNSKVSVLESRMPRSKCASVVRVRPRPRVNAPANNLLLRAVADAHKSLLNIPPKIDPPPPRVQQRALVLPMRRGRAVEKQNIVIQVSGTEATDDMEHDAISLGDPDSEDDKTFKLSTDEKEEYVPLPITKKIHNTDYTPSRRNEGRTSSLKDDSIVIETINIHNPTVGKDKNTQFIVTMDGYHPNAFLAKRLETEGLLEEEAEKKTPQTDQPDTTKIENQEKIKDAVENSKEMDKEVEVEKRLSNTSDESDTQVIIKSEKNIEKRKPIEVSQETPPVKKRKSSPIVFDVDKKKEIDKQRKRTESAGSDNHVVVTTNKDSHKYDSLPPLSIVASAVPVPSERKPVAWCRAFPSCRYGAACAFSHPRCKFAASCTRRGCVYEHVVPTPAPISPAPVVASHVVPAANYKSISTALPALCKFYPGCVNPACHFYHPKPCRYGKHCANKLDCNFYHPDLPNKWYPA